MLTVPDRILVLSRGKVTGEFLHDNATEEALILAAGAAQQTSRI
jgi:ABC-type sugar transport system ATPase subunit